MKKFLFFFCLCLGLVAYGAEDVNVTPSPDGSKEAFTRGNDLWVRDVATGAEKRLTGDGSETTLNGYASWVYYEEILGRPSKYRAFWWSPDSRSIVFYRFDNSRVPVFPIFSPFGQDGSLKLTRYPKAGEFNPEVRIGIANLNGAVIWADFEEGEQYFGTPFWGPDGREFFIQRQPRRQNQLAIYAVNALTGKSRIVYTEKNSTWVDMIEGMVFGQKGLYMTRDTDGWDQIYYLSYDGKVLKKLTDGVNWDMRVLKADEKKGNVWFMARRDNLLHPTVYRVDRRGRITTLTDPGFYASEVEFSEDGRTFKAKLSTASVPWKTVRCDAIAGYAAMQQTISDEAAGKDLSDMPKPEIVRISNDGYDLYGLVSYPRNFSRNGRYPVLMEVYGGPGTAYVRDRWNDRDASNRWCYENGIIYMVVDPRSSGENGRKGKDEAFGRMTVIELQDYIAWAEYMQKQPYVIGDRIGVEGFSFGGTTTSMLVLRYPQYFSCGIAGGGVYDWHLYDSIYTERFMDIPSENPEGYDKASVLTYIASGEVDASACGRLRLTHGTGDDNVHYQNTLQLVDALQKAGIQFELMLYPDGMHGYRGKQHEHDSEAAHDFWKRNLLR